MYMRIMVLVVFVTFALVTGCAGYLADARKEAEEDVQRIRKHYRRVAGIYRRTREDVVVLLELTGEVIEKHQRACQSGDVSKDACETVDSVAAEYEELEKKLARLDNEVRKLDSMAQQADAKIEDLLDALESIEKKQRRALSALRIILTKLRSVL